MTNLNPHETKIFKNQEHPWLKNRVNTMIQKKIISFIGKINVI